MAGTEHAEHLLCARDGYRIEDGPRRLRVVAPIHGVVGAVRVDGPEALGIPEIAVHVFPAVVEEPPVGEQGRLAFEERALAYLPDIGAVTVHPVQVAHDVTVAHAVLGLAGGGEHNVAVRQVQRIDVADAWGEGQLPESGAVGIDFIDVVIVLDVTAHGKENAVSVEMNGRVADDTVGRFQQRAYRVAARGIKNTQRAAALETGRVDFAGLKHGFGIVVVGLVLAPHNKKDALSRNREMTGLMHLRLRCLRVCQRTRKRQHGQDEEDGCL